MNVKLASTSTLLTAVSIFQDRSVTDMTDTDWDNLLAVRAELEVRA